MCTDSLNIQLCGLGTTETSLSLGEKWLEDHYQGQRPEDGPDFRTAGSRTQKREYGNIMSASRELGLLWRIGLGWVSGDMGCPLGSAFRTGRTNIRFLSGPQLPL